MPPGLAQNLFEYIVYDLDLQRITDFRLKPWADRFLTLRARLYNVEDGGDEENPPSNQGEETQNPPSIERVEICPQWAFTLHLYPTHLRL
jgi:hypothetical protein